MIEHVHRGGISIEVAEKLLEAFRRAPGHARSAAKAAGCDPRTATKAWARGWAHVPHAARPMKDIIAEEQVLARAMREEQEAETERVTTSMAASQRLAQQSKAARDAAATRAAEAVLVKVGRNATVNMVASVASMSRGVERLFRLGLIAAS